MNLVAQAWHWLTDPAHWTGISGIPNRLAEHVTVTFAALVVAAIIAIPAGLIIGHTRRGAAVVGAITGGVRAIPTLGLLTLLGLWLGIGIEAPFIALVVLAIPSLLVGAYSGVEAIDSHTPQAAQAIGMRSAQVLLTVELPLALPVIVGGIRDRKASSREGVSTWLRAADG